MQLKMQHVTLHYVPILVYNISETSPNHHLESS